jgi:flagellar capping protein FliD
MTGFRKTLLFVACGALVLAAGPAQAQGTLFVESDKVGIGIETPAVPLHVFVDSGGIDTTEFRLENFGGNRFDFVNTRPGSGGHWQFVNTSNPDGADLVIRELVHDPSVEFRLTQAGNLTISGHLFTGGTACGSGCDRVFSSGYELESIEQHARSMWTRGHLPAVGPMAENQPFNLTETTGGMLNELEKAHLYIEQLHTRIRDLEQSLEDKDQQLAARLARIEAQLQSH